MWNRSRKLGILLVASSLQHLSYELSWSDTKWMQGSFWRCVLWSMIHFLSKFVFMCLLLLLSCLTMFFQNVIAFSSIVLTRASIPPGTTCQMLNGVESIKSLRRRRRRRRRWFFNLHSLQITAGCLPVGILHRRFWWGSQAWLLWSAKTHRTLKAYSKQGHEMTKYIKIKSSIEIKAKNKTKPHGT